MGAGLETLGDRGVTTQAIIMEGVISEEVMMEVVTILVEEMAAAAREVAASCEETMERSL